LLAALLAPMGCGIPELEMRSVPVRAYDVAIVPGCPSEDDGSLSRCQMARALWAARMWERGWTRNFITSGAAVYSPYVEAEALAAAMTSLGVPPERIYLEPNALHTDENMYYSLQIARALGFRSVAVVSDAAAVDCRMAMDWGQPCSAFTLDLEYVRARHKQVPGRLESVRTRATPGWVPLAERERAIARATGRHRPPSFLLYLGFAVLRSNGERWVPANPPAEPPKITWRDRLAAPR
jgi:hypothetical protein